MHARLFFIFLMIIFCFKCQSAAEPKLNHNEKKLLAVYCELICIDNLELTQQARIDSAHRILSSHSLTRIEYDSLVNGLNTQPRKWKRFYELAQKKLASSD